jgi:hypothetical protein
LEVVTKRAAVSQFDARVTRLQETHARMDGTSVRHHEAKDSAEQPGSTGERRQAPPETEEAGTGRVEVRRHGPQYTEVALLDRHQCQSGIEIREGRDQFADTPNPLDAVS